MSAVDADLLATLTDEERKAFEPDDDADDAEALRAVAGGADDDEADEADDDDAETPAAPVEEPGGAPHAPADGAEADGAEAVDAVMARAPYQAQLPADFDAQMGAIKTEDAELRRQFKEGEIDADAYADGLAALQERRESLVVQRAKAEISGEMTAQSAQQMWQSTVNRFLAVTAKNEGIDYRKDKDLHSALDSAVKMLANDEANSDKPMAWFVEEAHRYVKFTRGIGAATRPAADAPAAHPASGQSVDPKKAAADRRKPAAEAVPKTLAQVPGGDGPGDVGSEFAEIDALDGEELESAIAKMSPAQRDKWLRG